MKRITKTLLHIAASLLAVFLSAAVPNVISAQDSNSGEAAVLETVITNSNGASVYDMNSESYNSMSTFNNGDTITITAQEPIGGLYICWNNKTVSPWTLNYNGTDKSCGTNGYLHEYVSLDGSASTATMKIVADGMKICKLYVLGTGSTPSWVQNWNASCDNADILLVSTHADDEQLFFGGIIPYYAGELGLKVQVAYYTNYWNGANIREHEKLDGLWTVGVRNYPVNGDFDDIYAADLEAAKTVYNYDDTIEFMVELIRRFKPLVMVGQDLNGEYGHGGHRLTAAAICEAVEISNDSTAYPESAEQYGTYDVPKTYLHLYGENKITLDCQRQLSNFNGQTVLDVAKQGYLQHVSQQWCWFYVSDDYEYSCADFGLYRTTVGVDTGNDMLENVTTYEEQQRIAEEEASREAESQSIAESIAQSEAQSEAQSVSEAESEAAHKADREKAHTRNTIITIIIVIAAVIIIFIIMALVIRQKRMAAKRRRKKRRK